MEVFIWKAEVFIYMALIKWLKNEYQVLNYIFENMVLSIFKNQILNKCIKEKKGVGMLNVSPLFSFLTE